MKKLIIFASIIFLCETIGWMRTIFLAITLGVAVVSFFRIFVGMWVSNKAKECEELTWKLSTKIIVFVTIVSATAIVTALVLHYIHPDITAMKVVMKEEWM